VRRSTTALLAAALLAGLPQLPATAEEPDVVWRSVLRSPASAPSTWCAGATAGLRHEAMPLVGVDPADPSRVRATWSAHGERLQVHGSSSDGGRTWTSSVVEGATSCSGGPADRFVSTNALLDVGAGGSAWLGESWFTSPSLEQPTFRYGGAVHALHRGGSDGPGTSPAGAERHTQNFAVAASPRDPDHVTVAWMSVPQVVEHVTYTLLPNAVRAAESRDGGRTWSAPVLVHQAPPGELVVNPRLVRASDGGLVVLIDQARLAEFPTAQTRLTGATFRYFAVHSADGRTWSAPVPIGTGDVYPADRPDEGPAPAFGAYKPDLAAGPDGTVVAAWHDSARSTVVVARSTDGGRSWLPGRPTVALDDAPFHAAVAVDGRGRTALTWYDFRADRLGDRAWTVQPRLAVQQSDGTWRQAPLDEPFDLTAAQSCTPAPDPVSPPSCTPGSHAGPLGVYQDLEGLPSGFLASYSVAGHRATDGLTDAVVARLR
jgi:hypothetical protein